MMRTAKFQRVPVAQPQQQKHRTKQFPAPVRGLVLNENLATSGQAAARQLDNWFPNSTGIRVRGGSANWQRIGTDEPVLSLWNYKTGGTEHFFGATETAIFNVTSVTDPDTIPAAVVTGRTSGLYATAQFATAGGEYLYAVNGVDKPLLYDGATFTAIDGSSTPAITGVTTTKFSHVWVYGNRLWFIEKGSMNAWYLPVDSLGGAAQAVSMAGIFQNGGELLFGARWSLDAGDGLDDKCLFVSTKGEVAVFQGTNPASATDWSKVGVYDITAPMGMKAIMQAGGDLLIAAEDGVLPISVAVQKDPAALSLAAVSRAIEPLWNEAVNARRTLPWEILKWPAANMMVVSQPVTFEGQDPLCLVANLETGAWCRYTGWDTRCLGLFQNYGFFGTSDGRIMRMETGGSDDGSNYTAVYVGQFDQLGNVGATKVMHQMRGSFLSASPFNPKLSASVNYAVTLPTAPNSMADYTVSEWDAGLWDEAIWDVGAVAAYQSRWVSIGRSGYSFAPQIQITFGVTPLPRIELVAIDVTYEGGGVVV